MTTIASVTAQPVSLPLHTAFITALRRTDTIESVVVQVTDSDGRVGWGEAPQVWQVTGECSAGAVSCVKSMLAPALVGLDVNDRDDLTRAAEVVQSAVARNFGAKAALDAALHDVFAQARGVSLVSLLSQDASCAVGAARDEPQPGNVLATDVTLAAGSSETLAASALARVADGFTTLKMKVGTDATTDVSRVAAVRAAVGEQITLRLDANQGWSRDEAVTVIRALSEADLGVEFVEQPIAADDVEGLAWVRARVELPIMADESCYGRFDLERIIRLEAADLVNVKLAKCGSLATGLGLLQRAHQQGLGTIVGSMMESHIGVGAAAALAVAEPTTQVCDLDAGWWAARSPVTGGLRYQDAQLVLSHDPGLGISGWNQG